MVSAQTVREGHLRRLVGNDIEVETTLTQVQVVTAHSFVDSNAGTQLYETAIRIAEGELCRHEEGNIQNNCMWSGGRLILSTCNSRGSWDLFH